MKAKIIKLLKDNTRENLWRSGGKIFLKIKMLYARKVYTWYIYIRVCIIWICMCTHVYIHIWQITNNLTKGSFPEYIKNSFKQIRKIHTTQRKTGKSFYRSLTNKGIQKPNKIWNGTRVNNQTGAKYNGDEIPWLAHHVAEMKWPRDKV